MEGAMGEEEGEGGTAEEWAMVEGEVGDMVEGEGGTEVGEDS